MGVGNSVWGLSYDCASCFQTFTFTPSTKFLWDSRGRYSGCHKTTIPHYYTTILQYNTTIPRYYTTILQYNKTIPRYYTTIPQYNMTIPRYYTTIPKYDYSPRYYMPIPQYDTTIPQYYTPIPPYDTTIPQQSRFFVHNTIHIAILYLQQFCLNCYISWGI